MKTSAVAVALLLAGCCLLLVPGSQGMGPCPVKPAATVIHVNSSWTADLMGNTAQPLITNELNGPNSANTANLIIPPGKGFPPHRHPGAEEYMYFTQGQGELTIWVPGQAAKSTIKIKAGDLHYTPPHGIHEVRNTGKVNLVSMTWVSPGPMVLEPFDKWPASLDVPQGKVYHIMDVLKAPCPYSQEEPQEPQKQQPAEAGADAHDVKTF